MAKSKLSKIEKHYEAYGEGPTLIIIPGLYSSTETSALNLLRPALEKHYKIIIGDNRGVGLSSKVNYDYSTEDMAEDWNELLENLGESSVHVLGSSMGSMIAQYLALNHPDKVRSLILADSAPRATVYIKQILDVWMFLTKQVEYHEFLRLVNIMCFTHEHYEAYGDSILKAEAVAKDLLAQCPPFNHEAFCRLCRAVISHNAMERLSEISAPTLVISGDRDLLCPAVHAQHMSEIIPNCKYICVKTCGHGIVFQKTEEFTRHVQSFLDDHS